MFDTNYLTNFFYLETPYTYAFSERNKTINKRKWGRNSSGGGKIWRRLCSTPPHAPLTSTSTTTQFSRGFTLAVEISPYKWLLAAYAASPSLVALHLLRVLIRLRLRTPLSSKVRFFFPILYAAFELVLFDFSLVGRFSFVG